MLVDVPRSSDPSECTCSTTRPSRRAIAIGLDGLMQSNQSLYIYQREPELFARKLAVLSICVCTFRVIKY